MNFREAAPPFAATMCAAFAMTWILGAPVREQGTMPREPRPLVLLRAHPRRLEGGGVTAVELAFRGATPLGATAAVAWDLYDGKVRVGGDRCTGEIRETREGRAHATVLFDLRRAPAATKVLARIGAVGPALEPLSEVVEVELAVVAAPPEEPDAPTH